MNCLCNKGWFYPGSSLQWTQIQYGKRKAKISWFSWDEDAKKLFSFAPFLRLIIHCGWSASTTNKSRTFYLFCWKRFLFSVILAVSYELLIKNVGSMCCNFLLFLTFIYFIVSGLAEKHVFFTQMYSSE